MELVLYAVDGTDGTLDPAFAAHLLPLKAWATAWWERWSHPESLENAYWSAQRTLQGGVQKPWARAAGPAADERLA